MAGLAVCSPASSQVLEPAPGSEPHLLPGDSTPPDTGGSQGWSLQRIKIAALPARILSSGRLVALATVRIESGNGDWFALDDCDDGSCANRVEAPHQQEQLPDGALPGSHLATDGGRIARAWLAEPTQRITGSAIGPSVAGALVVADQTTREYRLDLSLDQAFEDLRPRIVDLDGSGEQTLILVRSSIDRGAALIAVRLDGEGLLHIVGETQPLGRAGRWLNPAGIGDFTGGGRNSIAIVTDPDPGGRLQILDFSAHEFTPRFSVPGVSNHIPGKAIQDMAVVADFDGDGIADIAVPNATRKAIRILSFAHGRIGEPFDIDLPAPVATEVVGIAGPPGKRPMLLMGLEDGELILLH